MRARSSVIIVVIRRVLNFVAGQLRNFVVVQLRNFVISLVRGRALTLVPTLPRLYLERARARKNVCGGNIVEYAQVCMHGYLWCGHTWQSFEQYATFLHREHTSSG